VGLAAGEPGASAALISLSKDIQFPHSEEKKHGSGFFHPPGLHARTAEEKQYNQDRDYRAAGLVVLLLQCCPDHLFLVGRFNHPMADGLGFYYQPAVAASAGLSVYLNS
jgi:hypothetical protein